MRTPAWLMFALLGLLPIGFGRIGNAQTSPVPEARQALAPTGPLRVALQLANPLNIVEDATSG